MDFWKLHSRKLSLLAVFVVGLIIVSPYVNFQDYLSQGDHGRDLYAAQAVYRGELPYRDFWWVYGPLTPYYYGLFFKIFGTKISSMILGKLVLRIAGGLLLCLGLMQVCTPITALLGGIWYILLAQDFFFTYNHIAGVVMVIGTVWCLLSYIQRNSSKALSGALSFILILCLIKVNFGLAALVGAVITVAICDWVHRTPIEPDKKYFYIAALVGIPLISFIIYWALLHGLSVMEIRECLPYKEGDQPYSVSPWQAIRMFAQIVGRTITSNWENMTMAGIINASGLYCLYLFITDKLPLARKTFGLSIGMLCLFYVFNSHEYLKSGVWYRDFWAQPLSIMLCFLLIDTATRSAPQVLRKIVLCFIAAMVIICWAAIMRSVNAYKVDRQFFNQPRGGIYITNSPDWIATVNETTEYLDKTLHGNELFFALPYDCIYYYLTGKKTPTRQLIFFEHIKIPPEQEQSIIAELEKNHVNYVLVSSRAFAHQELGLGQLGSTYCPLIGKYIQDHFTTVARFGDWSHEPGWAWNHGTWILKRKGI